MTHRQRDNLGDRRTLDDLLRKPEAVALPVVVAVGAPAEEQRRSAGHWPESQGTVVWCYVAAASAQRPYAAWTEMLFVSPESIQKLLRHHGRQGVEVLAGKQVVDNVVRILC